LRKGSSTYALGHVNGPTPVSVFLRMGQSLGKLKDRYIHFGEGADQLCGRMIAGLPFNSDRFAVLPVHFKKETSKLLNASFWEEIVPGYAEYPHGIKTAFPFFLAAIIYHEPHLRHVLHPSHPIFFTRVFTNNCHLLSLKNSIILCTRHSIEMQMQATGIPPHLAVVCEIDTLKQEILALKTDVHCINSSLTGTFATTIAQQVTSTLKENFCIEGVLPITVHDIDNRIRNLRDEIIDIVSRPVAAPTQQVQPTKVQNLSAPLWKTWDWSDGLICHFVPPGWEFPTHMSVRNLWDLWHFGDTINGIRPYKKLRANVDFKASHRMRYSRAKKVMIQLHEHAVDIGVIDPGTEISSVGIMAASEIFNVAYRHLLARLDNKQSSVRVEELSYGTIYKKLPRA